MKQEFIAVLSMTCVCNVLYVMFIMLKYELTYKYAIICCFFNIVYMMCFALKKNFNLFGRIIVILLSILSCVIPIYLVILKFFPIIRINLPFSMVAVSVNILFFLICQVARKVMHDSTPSDNIGDGTKPLKKGEF